MFSFVPKFFVVGVINICNSMGQPNYADLNSGYNDGYWFWVSGVKSQLLVSRSNTKIIWNQSGTSFSWYNNNPGSYATGKSQMNESGVTYLWVSLG